MPVRGGAGAFGTACFIPTSHESLPSPMRSTKLKRASGKTLYPNSYMESTPSNKVNFLAMVSLVTASRTVALEESKEGRSMIRTMKGNDNSKVFSRRRSQDPSSDHALQRKKVCTSGRSIEWPKSKNTQDRRVGALPSLAKTASTIRSTSPDKRRSSKVPTMLLKPFAMMSKRTNCSGANCNLVCAQWAL